MVRSSLWPVWGAIERLRSTSFSRLMPSGVISYAHANIRAGTKPITSANNTNRWADSGRFNSGARISDSCNSSHEAMP